MKNKSKILAVLTLSMIMGNNVIADDGINQFKFISSFNDLPLYKDIELDENSKIEFDSIWGSVIEIDGICNCDCSYIKDYYDIIMPNLGWKATTRKSSKFTEEDNREVNIYTRGLITLTITSEKDKNNKCKINFSQTQL